MSKLSALCLAFFFIAGTFLISPNISRAAQGPEQKMYQKADARLSRLTKDSRKRRMRDQWERSISDFDNIVSKYPNSQYAGKSMYKKAEACAGMYRVSRTQHDLDMAIEAYEQFVAKYPKSADVKGARAGLKSLTGVDPSTASASRRKDKSASVPGSPVASAESNTDDARASVPVKAAADDRDKVVSKAPASEVVGTRSTGGLVSIKGIRHWSNKGYTRVVIDLDGDVTYKARRIKRPDRLFFDIRRSRITAPLKSTAIEINDGILKTVRPSQYNKDTVRVVLDLASLASYRALLFSDPPRLVVDVTGKDAPGKEIHAQRLGHARLITLRSIDKGGRAQALASQPVIQNAEQSQPAAEQASPEQNTVQPAGAQGETSQPPAGQGAAPAAAEAQKPLSLAQQMGLCIGTIVIDPGHGGKDTGAIGKNGLLEKDVVLDVGLRLRDILREELGCKVVMTRDRDIFIDLDARPGTAVQNDADLFISIHANASRNRQARGIETYLLNLTKDRNIMEVAARENMTTLKNMGALDIILKDLILDNKRDESLRLAHAVQANLVRDLQKVNGAVMDKGAKQGPFLVLYGASMPSILTEVGFISNPDEESLLASPGYRQEVAQAIYDGIKEYIANTKVVAVNPAP
jgi:N-acetylmuramoyl-L-alanine amidase